ncbi:hypothetical protein [Specibacter sp. RAF43]|uniref:hypothetical protein n=1 Tax=Specibacter sp. RAF43 TaxID=3233057 RepID=UPI003F9DC631
MPLVILVIVCLAVILVARVLGRKGTGPQGGRDVVAPRARKARGTQATRKGVQITRSMAAEASARLTPEQHRSIYSLIAQQQVVGAIKEYRHATKSSLRESAAAVTALGQFPQPAPEPGWSAPAPPARTGVPAGYRYRAIVSRGEEVREVASTRLNEDIFQQIRSLALGGNYDDAAALLRRHADIAEDQAREFVSMIGPEE